MPGATTEQRIATGVHRNTLFNEEGGTDREQFRVESVVDRTNTTGTIWLGLTVGCAQCHDHKYDPVGQRDYYRLYAFLNNCDEPVLESPVPGREADRERLRAELDAAGKRVASAAKKDSGVPAEELKRLRAEAAKLRSQYEATVRRTLILAELPPGKARTTHVHIRGDFLRKGVEVSPGVPAVLPQLPTGAGRLDLARWLVSDGNPLAARVAVNRLWQMYFGVGLVETENDFGLQGARPTHPELPDWLACEFRDRGWSLKAMHRLIVTSATYRQSSRRRAELDGADPRNRLLARQNRLRLDAEIIRDSGLTVSGLLNPAIGGPSVFPPQPEGADAFTQNKKNWKTSPGRDAYRRAMYTFLWRSAPHPGLTVFDAPDGNAACTRRNRSNTPLQALTLANDAAFVEFARALGLRALREAGPSDEARLRHMFRLALARTPSAAELSRLAALLSAQRVAYRADPAAANALVGPAGTAEFDWTEQAAFASAARVLLNLDEFITRE
jgi:hypothetical protein